MSVMRSSRKPKRFASDWQTQVSISNDHTLRSRVKGNFHARFWIGGGGSNPFADHTKKRNFAALINVSLDELVPQDHFYRHLERTLDLSFVREFVHETYAGGGRPSIDPVVFFKLQLVMFFEGIRSERQLMRHAADRLSVRWFLGVRHVTQGSIPSETERTSRRFFGLRAYLMPKGKGDSSMLLKHGEAKAL